MKGRELTIEEVLRLPNETKIIMNSINLKDHICTKRNTYLVRESNGVRYDIENYSWENLGRKAYLYEEELKMKEYQTWELLKLAASYTSGMAGTKRPIYKNIKGIEIMVGNNFDGNGLFLISGSPYKNVFINENWELVQQTVTFMEAMEAYKNKKVIKCKIENREYFYNGLYHNFKFEEMTSLRDNKKQGGISVEEILNGTWYIEE